MFKDLDLDEDNIIYGKNLNIAQIPKNILRIISPIIKEILKNKNKAITKDEFIFFMNQLFDNISPIERRLIIYSYNNRKNKNNSFVSYNNKYNNLKKNIFSMRPATPNFSIGTNHYKNEIINKNYNYGYNYYNSDKIREFNNISNNNKDGYPKSRTQKNIDEYLYGNNSHYYYGY